MGQVSLVNAASVRSLTCPYCGRRMPRDEPGMFAAQARWGFAGAQVSVEGEVVGLLLVSAAAEPGDSSAVALLSGGWVAESSAGHGLGKELVRTLAGALVHQKVGSVIASSETAAGCAAFPRGWLEAVGFGPTSHRTVWRLDLGQAVVRKQSLRRALNRLVEAVRPVPPPEPVGRSDAR